MEGDKFYYKILAKDSKTSTIFKNYFYKDHKYNYLFKLITQFIWILVLILTLFAVKCKNERNMIIYLSLIGITIFLLIFECRARYLYCYSPIFVTASMIGLSNIKNKYVKKTG